MFDISWTEFLLIGVVALIVIGPKELPGVLRTLGQWTRKVRGMAADFQNQFQEAMREAEMTDLKKQVDDMAHDFKNFDPLKGVRDGVESVGKDVESLGKDLETSLHHTPDTASAATEQGETVPAAETDAVAALPEPAVPGDELAIPDAGAVVRDQDAAAAATSPAAPEAAEAGGQPNTTERIG